MSNELEPGNGGLPTAATGDSATNPPSLGLPPPKSGIPQHFASEEDQARLKFDKIKDASDKVAATRTELDKLIAFGDTVSVDDVVEAAAGMVAAGIGATDVAGTLADMPEQPAQLQAWVKEQSEKLKPSEVKVQQALAGARQALGTASFRSILAHSAESHFQRKFLAASKPVGRPN